MEPKLSMANGVAYMEDGDVIIQDRDGNETNLTTLLEDFEGCQVSLHLGHHPPSPPQPDRWGQGSCLWEPAECPAGHHKEPQELLSFTQSGKLRRDGKRWFIQGIEVPLVYLEGHHSQLVAIQSQGSRKGTAKKVEELTQRATALRDLLVKLRSDS